MVNIYKITLNEVITEKKKLDCSLGKKDRMEKHGHRVHLADTLSISEGCATPVINGEAGNAHFLN